MPKTFNFELNFSKASAIICLSNYICADASLYNFYFLSFGTGIPLD